MDTLQLLSAWTWSDDFALQERFQDLTEDLEPFGFRAVGEDTNLLLRCCAAAIAQDASPNTLVNLNGVVVRQRFQEVVNGISGAIDFLRTNLSVHSLNNLPYTTVLVPLSVFFAVPGDQQLRYTDEQRRMLVRWFWRCCFSRRYSSGVLRNLKADIDEMIELKHRRPSGLGSFATSVKPDFFMYNNFRVNNVNTKTFVLQLAQQNPLSFVSGSSVSLRDVLEDYNRNEFHHLYPRKFLRDKNTEPYREGCLANFCFLSKADNAYLGGVAPSVYRKKMPDNVGEILQHALCPESLFDDNFQKFISERAQLLNKDASHLIQ